MENLDLLARRGRVPAPPGFEISVLARLAEEKRRRMIFRRAVRFAWAGGAALFLAGFLSLHLLDRHAGVEWKPASEADTAPRDFFVIPIMETMDYFREVRRSDSDTGTIYILEQVSEAVALHEIMY